MTVVLLLVIHYNDGNEINKKRWFHQCYMKKTAGNN